jgi:hypothetical protein
MEQNSEKKRQIPPPYVAYRTFQNFLDSLRVGMPNRIDRSLMGSMSGAIQGQLIATLKYLELVSPVGVPSEKLSALVKSEGVERKRNLLDILRASYRFLFSGGFDLMTATARQLEEQFTNAGVSGETVRKCIAFFIAAAKEAEVPLSPYISSVKGARNIGQRARRSPVGTTGQVNVVEKVEPTDQAQGTTITWSQLLLSKFPSFDPAWSDEVKTKWFDAFDRLMKMVKQGE